MTFLQLFVQKEDITSTVSQITKDTPVPHI